jgi:uncharacterized protein
MALSFHDYDGRALMQTPLAAFHVMAKPTGARCNLRCAYCFFLKKKRLYPHSSLCMSDSIMRRYLRQTIRAHRVPEVTIAWQGGEPTLMGVDFFRRAAAAARTYAGPTIRVQHTLQTNGSLIDERWCEFLRENRFLVGLSLDGPQRLHDTFRKDKNGRSVFNNVIRAARLMQHYGVEYNILCTVNAVNSLHPLEVYRFFRDELEARYLQFIPIVERDNETGDQTGDRITARSVRPECYGNFLSNIFDEWVKRDAGRVFVQMFDGVLAAYVRGYSSLCVLQPACGEGVALEHNGDVYSCDHYVDTEHFLGNIRATSIEKIVGSEKQRAFGAAKRDTLPRRCRECRFCFTCYGECPKNRVLDAPDGSGKINWLCAGLKHFFAHTEKPMRTMAGLIQKGRAASEIMQIMTVGEKHRGSEAMSCTFPTQKRTVGR